MNKTMGLPKGYNYLISLYVKDSLKTLQNL